MHTHPAPAQHVVAHLRRHPQLVHDDPVVRRRPRVRASVPDLLPVAPFERNRELGARAAVLRAGKPAAIRPLARVLVGSSERPRFVGGGVVDAAGETAVPLRDLAQLGLAAVVAIARRDLPIMSAR